MFVFIVFVFIIFKKCLLLCVIPQLLCLAFSGLHVCRGQSKSRPRKVKANLVADTGG